MKAATRANTRTAAAANEEGQGKALRIAFFGGAVMGLAVASLGLIGLGALYLAFAADAVPGPGEVGNLAQIGHGFARGAIPLRRMRCVCSSRPPTYAKLTRTRSSRSKAGASTSSARSPPP